MTLSDITLSIELAKELKELLMPQNSIHFHTKAGVMSKLKSEVFLESVGNIWDYAAPTAEEILEYLPDVFNTGCYNGERDYELLIQKVGNKYVTGYYDTDYPMGEHEEESRKLVDALGKLLIWCEKEGYVTFPKHD